MSDPRLLYYITFRDTDSSWFRPVKKQNTLTDAETPSFTAGKFGNEYTPAHTSKGVYSSVTTLEIPPEGCMEIWLKLSGWSWTTTTASDGNDKMPVHFRTGNFNPQINVNFDSGVGIIFDLNMAGTNQRMTVTSQSFSDGQTIHFAISWKEAGASGLMKMYVDGVEVGTKTANLGITGSKQNGPGFGGAVFSSVLGWIGPIGNGKLWSYYKTDFSDRERPRFGMNDSTIYD